jgi:hypothetical protein
MPRSAICQASPFGDWAKENKLPEASVFGFRGWQVNPNSVFGDGETRLKPLMEVWCCAIAGMQVFESGGGPAELESANYRRAD